MQCSFNLDGSSGDTLPSLGKKQPSPVSSCKIVKRIFTVVFPCYTRAQFQKITLQGIIRSLEAKPSLENSGTLSSFVSTSKLSFCDFFDSWMIPNTALLRGEMATLVLQTL